MNELLHDVSWVLPYRTETLTTIFEFFTWMGYPTFIMLLLALGYWLWDKSAFTRLSILVILTTLLNAYLKDLWQNPRPDIALQLDPDVGQTYGMPSGHAQIAFALWFGLAYEIKRQWAWVVAGVIVAGVCFSRIYLGVHDLEDILAGSAIALMILFLYKFLSEHNSLRFLEIALWKSLAALLVLSLLLYYAWPNEAYTVQALALSGFLAGWFIGRHLDHGVNAADIVDRSWAIPAVIVIGVVGFLALFAIIKPAMSAVGSPYANYLQTGVIGIYITFIAPLLFRLCRTYTRR